MTAKEEVILAAHDVEPGRVVGRIRQTVGGRIEEETVRRGRFDHSEEPLLASDPELHAITVGDEHKLGALALAYMDPDEEGVTRAAIEQRVGERWGVNAQILRDAVTNYAMAGATSMNVVSATGVPENVLTGAGFTPDESGGYTFTARGSEFVAPAANAA